MQRHHKERIIPAATNVTSPCNPDNIALTPRAPRWSACCLWPRCDVRVCSRWRPAGSVDNARPVFCVGAAERHPGRGRCSVSAPGLGLFTPVTAAPAAPLRARADLGSGRTRVASCVTRSKLKNDRRKEITAMLYLGEFWSTS